jgi:hypothetical protein
MECHVLDGGRIQVEGWFDLGGAARGARVQVYRAGQLCVEGQLNRDGVYVFSLLEARAEFVGLIGTIAPTDLVAGLPWVPWQRSSEILEGLTVRVIAGPGHSMEEFVPLQDKGWNLRSGTSNTGQKSSEGKDASSVQVDEKGAADPQPLSDRSSRVHIKDVIIGLAFLMAAAGFLLSLRNAQRLRQLSQDRMEKNA